MGPSIAHDGRLREPGTDVRTLDRVFAMVPLAVDRYFLQKDGKVVEWPEHKFRRKLRKGGFSGMELVRHEDDEEWSPLYELPIYSEEVPHLGDPRTAAQRKVARGFGWHLVVYLVVTNFIFGALSIPAAIWGLFLLGHAAKALPVTWSLVREGRLLSSGGNAKALTSGAAELQPGAPVVQALPAAKGFDADLQAVRAALGRRSGPHTEPMLAELDRVAQTVKDLRDKISRLSALLEIEDREDLERQREVAQRSLSAAVESEDRELRERQVQVLRDRVEAEERARRTLERLRIRQSLAEQQVRQLRLDLLRAEAREAAPDDLGGRLEQIRIELEAAEEVEDLLKH